MERFAYDHRNKYAMIFLRAGQVGKTASGADCVDNQWVTLKDAMQLADESERQRNVNVDLHLEIDRLQSVIRGYDSRTFAIQNVPDVKNDDINRLLNELYHDRARLERVVKRFAEFGLDAIETVEGMMNRDYGGADKLQELDPVLIDVITVMSRLGALVDEHGGD